MMIYFWVGIGFGVDNVEKLVNKVWVNVLFCKCWRIIVVLVIDESKCCKYYSIVCFCLLVVKKVLMIDVLFFDKFDYIGCIVCNDDCFFGGI